MQHHNTVIIGGGIAGLACAHTLQKHNENFLLITKDIGGRIATEKNGRINYGAFFVTDSYHHLLPFVSRGKRIKTQDMVFHKGEQTYSALSLATIPYISQYLRFHKVLREFQDHYSTFRKRCEKVSQKEAIEEDPYLHDLYTTQAKQLIEKHNIGPFVDKFIDPIIYAMSFTPAHQLSGFFFLLWNSEMMRNNPTEFYFEKEKMIAPFKDKIVIDTTIEITKENDLYHIKTEDGAYTATHVVVATQPWIAKTLLKIEKQNEPISAYMKHVSGEIKRAFRKKPMHVYHSQHDIVTLVRQGETYLVYHKQPDINLEHYFDSYTIIHEQAWNPAFVHTGPAVIEAKRDQSLYLIGDHQIAGMEDAFITGIYAAHQIIHTR